jgi:hypothetical protein
LETGLHRNPAALPLLFLLSPAKDNLMRTLSFVPALLLLLAVASPLPLRAQFQQPTAEELKMTDDPAHPGAAAVYLFREDKTDDSIHFHSEYDRIKVLKDAGKELATIHLGYLKGNTTIEAIRGRTIHADGSIVPLDVKPENLLHAKEGDIEIKETVFNMPSVEVGSILEYYYQVRYDSNHFSVPHWEIQTYYPVRKERYFFQPLRYLVGNALMWYVKLPAGKSVAPDALERFTVELADVPPLPREEWAPPAESLRYQVLFYLTDATTGAVFWTDQAKSWLGEVEEFTKPTNAIKQAAAGLVTPADSEIDKARKLYAAVQALDNTDFSRKKSETERKDLKLKSLKRAEDVWTQKSGDRNDIALLYLAFLRAAGLTAYPMKVVNRQEGIFNQNYLDFSQLSDVVIILSTGGQEIVLDPGQKMCPFQTLSWRHSGAGGVRKTEKGNGPWVTPFTLFSDNTITRRGDLTISPGGEMTAKIHLSFTGQEALYWRQQALRVDETELKHSFEEWMTHQLPTGVEVHLTRFANLGDPASDLEAYATASGSLGAATSKRLMLPAAFFANAEEHTFVEQSDRKLDVDMHYAEQYKDGVLYHLPAGFSVEALPPTASPAWPGNAVMRLQSKTSATGSDVLVNRALARAFTLLDAGDYGKLRDFYQKVAAADQQQLVLSRAPVAKGN